MTFLLFVLNIIQVCLLDKICSLYWILICPGIIFVAFTSWAFVFIHSNREIFYDQSSRAAKDGENARQHLKALFSLQGRSEHSKQYDGREPNCKWLSFSTRALTAYQHLTGRARPFCTVRNSSDSIPEHHPLPVHLLANICPSRFQADHLEAGIQCERQYNHAIFCYSSRYYHPSPSHYRRRFHNGRASLRREAQGWKKPILLPEHYEHDLRRAQ